MAELRLLDNAYWWVPGPESLHGEADAAYVLRGRQGEDPALGTHGNSTYNAYLGPTNKTMDLSLVRSFRFRSSQRLEARVEAFNALNWFRPGDPVITFSSATFGQILTAGDPRIMQFAVKYQF